MPKLKCDWNCCKHNDTAGNCDNPDEVKLSTVVIVTEDKELLECKSFVDFEEGGAIT